MAIYLKNFETMSQYNAYTADTENFILPNVSYTVDNNTVHYNSNTPSHDFVEIGGIKWATMNVGATAATDTGLYFQWGDTQGYTADQVGDGEGQKYFGEGDYKYYNDGTYTKYYSDGEVLDLEDDAVAAAWGGGWRMPTVSEFVALGEATTSAWTADYEGSGVAGVVCTDKTDSSKKLFFPAAGLCSYGSMYNVGSKGLYWSSSLNYNCDPINAYCLGFSSDNLDWSDDYYRYCGFLVRGILVEN